MDNGLIKDNILVTSVRNNEVYILQHNTVKNAEKVAVKKCVLQITFLTIINNLSPEY
jgi:hypothetical protein